MELLKYPEKGRFPLEGVVTEWKKNQGEDVGKGDCLLLIEATGQLLEVESASEGTLLKILKPMGSFVKSSDSLAVIGNRGEDVSNILTHPQQKQFSEPVKEIQSPVQISPAASIQATDTQTPSSPNIQEDQTMSTESSIGNSGNVIPIIMPQAGQSMEEGTIIAWKVAPGDRVEVGQVIMEIETDKATVEVEADNPGRIARIVAKEGAVVEVKKPVAYIAENDADVDAYLGGAQAKAPEQPVAPAAPAPAPVPTPSAPAVASVPAEPSAPSPAPVTEPVSSAPKGEAVPILMPQAGQSMEEGTIISWKIAEGDQVEVGQIIMAIETDKATVEVEAEQAGRITRIVAKEGDVVKIKEPVAYMGQEGAESASAPAPAAAPTAPAKPVELAPASAATSAVSETDVVVHTVSKMRRAIAKNLSYSKQTIPHFYAKKTIDAGALFTTYRKTKEQFKCSINDFVTMACAKAIRQYPAFRSQYKETEVLENPSVNIGIAVGTEDGLTVPVVLNADCMNLQQLAAQTRQVVESARNGKLEGFGQGVFTVTNLGMFGVEEFLPIINPPESAILAVGAIVEGVKVKDAQMTPTRLMTVTLSVDHRIIDGVLAAQFLNTLQELLEAPEKLVS